MHASACVFVLLHTLCKGIVVHQECLVIVLRELFNLFPFLWVMNSYDCDIADNNTLRIQMCITHKIDQQYPKKNQRKQPLSLSYPSTSRCLCPIIPLIVVGLLECVHKRNPSTFLSHGLLSSKGFAFYFTCTGDELYIPPVSTHA